MNFKYNSAGIRTSKSYYDMNTGALTASTFILDGSNIIKEDRNGGGLILYYYYDASGVTGFEYNNNKYYYGKNLQGDIIKIFDASGIEVVTYKYDAWGNIISISGSFASTVGQYNPFRYRSYYYDSETGWYYLNSRYYDPSVGRFINADGIIGANGGLQGYNIFAYCNNDPVNHSDPTGYCDECGQEYCYLNNEHEDSGCYTGVDLYTIVYDCAVSYTDGFCDYFTDRYNNTKSFISDPLTYCEDAVYDYIDDIKENPLYIFPTIKADMERGQACIEFFADIIQGDYKSVSYKLGYMSGFAAEVITTCYVGEALTFNANGGYGIKIGKLEFLYREPSVNGKCIVAYRNNKFKFRIEYDTVNGWHYHKGVGKEAQKHHKITFSR